MSDPAILNWHYSEGLAGHLISYEERERLFNELCESPADISVSLNYISLSEKRSILSGRKKSLEREITQRGYPQAICCNTSYYWQLRDTMASSWFFLSSRSVSLLTKRYNSRSNVEIPRIPGIISKWRSTRCLRGSVLKSISGWIFEMSISWWEREREEEYGVGAGRREGMCRITSPLWIVARGLI